MERCRSGWSREAECPGRVRIDRACVQVREGHAPDRAALGRGPELPLHTCQWVFHSQVGPGNVPTGSAPLDTYKDKCPRCHPYALEAAIKSLGDMRPDQRDLWAPQQSPILYSLGHFTAPGSRGRASLVGRALLKWPFLSGSDAPMTTSFPSSPRTQAWHFAWGTPALRPRTHSLQVQPLLLAFLPLPLFLSVRIMALC